MYDHRKAVGECNGTEEECPGEEDCEVCQEQGKLKSRTILLAQVRQLIGRNGRKRTQVPVIRNGKVLLKVIENP